jgi:CRISPR system Cascade subunit CasA
MMMNLVTDPWLPVSDTNNRLCYISLNHLFEQPMAWLDLVLRPHERVSVMRLLICIGQAALNGPADIDEWNEALEEIPQVCFNSLKEAKGSCEL